VACSGWRRPSASARKRDGLEVLRLNGSGVDTLPLFLHKLILLVARLKYKTFSYPYDYMYTAFFPL
jgi:hypothetical protein